jgi:hypothetical protein
LDYPISGIGIGKAAAHMATDRIIDCIGASDEDIAHLRLLIRTATQQLRDNWQWGTEDKADLVIVNAHSLIGDSALRRSQQRGISYAQLIEAGDNAPDWQYLRKPLRRGELVDLLNGIGGTTIAPMTILSQGDDFFDMDLGEHENDNNVPSGDFAHRLHSAQTRLRSKEAEPEQDAIEAIFRRDSLAHKPEFLMPDKLAHGVGVEYVHGTTERSASRADAVDPFSRVVLSIESIDPSFRHDVAERARDNEVHSLSAYLDERLLGGPARIELPNSPALALDPKEQVFHAEGTLLSLEGYCCQPLRLGAWTQIVTAELTALRARAPARPYSYLRWMDRYVNSNGYLASHLDPAGTYRLTRRLTLAQDFPTASRVASQMLSPLRLDEIARASEVALADVFDVVNAYEAIGYVEWKHRVRTPR